MTEESPFISDGRCAWCAWQSVQYSDCSTLAAIQRGYIVLECGNEACDQHGQRWKVSFTRLLGEKLVD